MSVRASMEGAGQIHDVSTRLEALDAPAVPGLSCQGMERLVKVSQLHSRLIENFIII